MSIVVLVGSMRFKSLILRVAEEETAAGNIVLAPFATGADPDHQNDAKAAELDKLTQQRIDLSERVIVVTDSTGYLGYSAKHALAYALMKDMSFDMRQEHNESE